MDLKQWGVRHDPMEETAMYEHEGKLLCMVFSGNKFAVASGSS